ncbi:hypothetical protein Calkro_0894 [Caldicellulosiruptor kronotskyensis 2002]|uniref:DUF4330 domain-containing protein n=1 Tax=Caldicellulosiruptor kronotskyensis (strain DSM 18902 / VKM B-2412 / 2002) TaxID=632348 RepID=E4SDF7_CALK2|nr:DUF4330 domain-containing protein [Caldicellulosiruptor kronotskyensis]ADQ45766.1 hypothetical protein Calkro_0894 [Caldicellulosiruptor kronotskyensis 2002]
MKIVDQKGKLFGIINIVDLILIVLIVAIAWVGFAKISSHTKSSENTPQNEFVEIKPGEAIINVKIPLVDPAMAQSLHKKDYLVTGDTLTKSYIQDIQIKDGIYERTSSDGKIVVATHPYKKDVYLTIYGYVTLQGATIKLDKQTVRVGKTFYVKTRTTELVGVVTGVKIVKE